MFNIEAIRSRPLRSLSVKKAVNFMIHYCQLPYLTLRQSSSIVISSLLNGVASRIASILQDFAHLQVAFAEALNRNRVRTHRGTACTFWQWGHQ
jgi:hypothetical protein